MNNLLKLKLFSLTILLGLLVTACSQDSDVAIAVALTQTAVVLEELPPPVVSTEAPATAEAASDAPDSQEVAAPGDFQPLSADECSDLADAMTNTLGVEAALEEVLFEDLVSDRTGTGCQSTATGNGLVFDNVVVVHDAVLAILQARGWAEDSLNAGGGGGPGGILTGLTQGDGICQLVVISEPSEEELCSQDEPFSTCWEKLTPEQQLYTITLNCAQDTSKTSTSQAGLVFSRIEPLEFGPMQIIVLTGVPLMLPAEFPVEEGLPAINPYIYTSDEGEYELSLDYGSDCQGAGACHYGSLTGKKVDASEPVGTSNFPFEPERAQAVTLANGIAGYFIEALCGANCDDAKVFWIYNGYQYMVGLKAGLQADVVALANAAITNSIQ